MGRRSFARTIALLVTATLVVAACGGVGGPGGGASPLTRPAEFVISTSPGGGSDIYARFWIGIVESEGLTNQPLQPVNREGGAGAVAFNSVFERTGDPHVIMVTLNSFFLTMAIQDLPYQALDFTPIANIAFDPFFLWVHADSDYQTVEDFLAEARTRSIVVIGTGSRQEDELLFLQIQEAAGTMPFSFIPETGGGLVAAALAGQQGGVEATVNNPAEGLPHFPDSLRPLCAFLDESPSEGAFEGVPTCQDEGLDVEPYFNTRAVFAPPGLTPEAQEYWVEVFRRVSESQTWQDFVEEQALVSDFRSGEEFRQLVEELDALHREIAEANGWIE
ncbi:MAG: Bug family tripartite tricarboxylate transporter substrate binding protein [Candidatus Limnocylindria bacterium]